MIKYVLCCCAAALSLSSCADMGAPELPEDQAVKVRQHRMLPSEDLEENGKTKEGSPLPATSEGSWKF